MTEWFKESVREHSQKQFLDGHNPIRLSERTALV